jgi:asparagine synthase (glutamine-hydrolysing)
MAAAGASEYNDGLDFWLGKGVGLAHEHFWINPQETGELQPLVDPGNGCVLTCSARLDNRPELMHEMGLAGPDASLLSDAELILRAYGRWGIECANYLLGDFALVIWDPAKNQIFTARDALGGEELYYFMDRKILIMARHISSLLKHPAVQPRLNETKIAKYLAVEWDDDVNTFYGDIYHLPPGYCLLISADSSRLWRNWEVDPGKKIRYAQTAEYADHYRELITEALRNRSRSAYPLGLSLSGGLDSSSLAGLAGAVFSEKNSHVRSLNIYSYIFDVFPNCDERRYILPVIEMASQDYPIHHKMMLGDGLWPEPFAQDWLVSRDYPIQDPYYYLLKEILQCAHQDGVRAILSGFYGDDLYSGAEYWFADMLLELRFRQAAKMLAGSIRNISPKMDLFEFGLRAMIPPGLKKYYRTLRPRRMPAWKEWIHPGLAERSRLETQVLLHKNLANFRLPGQRKRFSALFFTGYPESVTCVQDIARENGMEYRFPFMDRRIVEFMLGLPSEQVAKPGVSRLILRETMRRKMPEVVRQRQDKAGLLDLYEKGIYINNCQNMEKVFLHSQVVERGFIKPEWLSEELNCKWRTQEGFILWLVITLETWLNKYW